MSVRGRDLAIGALIGGGAALALWALVSAKAKKEVSAQLESGRGSIEAEIRTQVDSQVRPAVDQAIRSKFAEYGITPQLMQSFSRVAQGAGRIFT